jgi:RHS repeat-associated protein
LALTAIFYVFALVPGSIRQAAADSAPGKLVERSRVTNTYRNPDGSFTRDMFAAPVNFRDASGKWQAIDSTLVPSTVPGYMYRTRANDFHVLFKGQLDSSYLGFQVAHGIYALSLKGAAPRTARVGEASVRYNSAFAGADLSYQVRPDGVEEALTLHSASVPAAYHFILTPPDGVQLQAKRLRGGAWMFVAAGRTKPVFLLSPPHAVDANGKDGARHTSIEVARTGSSYAIRLGVDAAWLHASDRTFPVIVDPTLTLQPAAMTGNFDVSCGACTDTATPLWTGADDTDVWRTLLRFDLSALPPASQISQATVGLWNDSTGCVPVTGQDCEASSHTLELHRSTAAWDTNTQSNQLAFDPTVLSTATLAVNAPDQWVNWDATGLAQGWANGSQSNYGVLIKRSTEPAGAGGPAFPGNDATDPTHAPKLTITYKGDGVTLDMPGVLHGSGADLHWSKWDGSSGNAFGGYEVHRSTDPAFTPSAANLVTTIGDAAVTSYTDTTAKPSTTFTYKIVVNGVASYPRTATLPADGQSTMTLPLTSDNNQATYLENDPTTTDCANYGGTDSLMVGSSGDATSSTTYRPVLSFDLRGIPTTATVTNATLKLYGDAMPPSHTVNVEAHRVTGAWKQGTGGTAAALTTCTGDGATWFESDGGVSWRKPGGDFDPAVVASVTHSANDLAGWDSFNLASMVQQWVNGTAPNLGVLFKFNDETPGPGNWFDYYTGTYTWDPTLRPQLALTYTDGNHSQPPSVAISSPADGDNVGGTVHVTAAAADDGHAAKVDFQVDGNQVGSSTSAPFAFDWNSAAVSAGSHTLRAVATDDAGNTATSSNVTVNVDNSAAPTTSITSPLANATISGTATVTANAADDRSVGHVEFYVDNNRFGDTTTSPYSVPLNTTSTSDPVYDGTHTLTTKAYDAGGHVTTSAPVTVTVANAPPASEYAATIIPTDIPPAVTYDPAVATQQQSGYNVTLTNKSSVTWNAANVVLQPRWVSSDPTPVYVDGTQVPLSANVMPGGTQTLTAQMTPPTLPDGVDRARYTLRFDLYDKSTSHWFSDEGNEPFENPVTVNKALVRDALGLERYYHYVGHDVGGGFQQLTNVANGNSLLRWTPFDEPGKGLATVLDLTYNALEKKCNCPTGNNWSLALSSLTRFGQRLEIHPNKSDDIGGGSNKYIEFTDGDGTTHRFTDTNNDGYWEAPAGIHLYLRQYSTTDTSKWWALTRPDRATFFYDKDGYATSAVDANANATTFTETAIAPDDDPDYSKQHVTKVTDAGGRSFTISYYTKSDSRKPQIRGKVKDITDHLGRTLHFDYYFDGNLLRLTQRGGTNADGTFLADRSWVFTYTTSSGSGPAITDPNARANPDPKTSDESTRIYSVRDPRGNETKFAYLGSGNGTDRWKLAAITDRGGNQTTFAYDTTNRVTTLTEPLSRVWKFAYDTEGKVTTITNPLNQAAQIAWSGDRQVSKVTEPSGAAMSYSYNDNGYLLLQTDQLGNTTKLTYQNIVVDANDTSTHWESGRTTPHISQLATKQTPKGAAAGTGYQWQFVYDGNGNVTSVADPAGNKTTTTYNADGTLATMTDPNGHANTYGGYDANGLAGSIKDADGNVTRVGYDATGATIWTEDANHVAADPDTAHAPSASRATYLYYDSFGRLGRQSSPKSTVKEPGTLIWSDTSFDQNNNVVGQQAPHYGTSDGMNGSVTTSTFDTRDEQTSTTSPLGEKTVFTYDAGGRTTSAQSPNGVKSGVANADSTGYTYDLLDRVVTQTAYGSDGTTAGARVTHDCYDLASDLRTVTAPNGNGSFTACPDAAVTPYTPLGAPSTTKYTYDAAHHMLSSKDPDGHSQSNTYDANGNVNSMTDGVNVTSTTSFDQLDRPVKMTEPFDTSTSPVRYATSMLQYDAAGNVAKEISARAYDASADKSTFADYVTTYNYDAADRLIRTDLPHDAALGSQLFQYQRFDATGQLTAISLPTATNMSPSTVDWTQIPASGKTTVSYSDAGDVTSENNPADPAVQFGYSAEGWQVSRTPNAVDVNGNDTGAPDTSRASDWTYDADGRATQATDPGSHGSTTYQYDANGNLTGASEGRGVQDAVNAPKVDATMTYNGFDERTKVSEKAASQTNATVTSYQYDSNGNVTQLVDNAVTDPNGNMITNGDTQQYTYSGADWLQNELDQGTTPNATADDRTILWTYDGVKHPLVETVQNGSGATIQQATAAYYANGLRKTFKTTGGSSGTLLEQHTLGYVDSRGIYTNGNLVSDQLTLAGPSNTACKASSCTQQYGYDALDRLITANNGHGTTTTYTFDPAGDITQQTAGSNTTTFTYNGTRLATETDPNSSAYKFRYDQNGNLDCELKSTGTFASDCVYTVGQTSSANLVARYHYDSQSRMLAVDTFTKASTPAADLSSNFTYDPLNRVFTQTEKHGTTAARTTAFSYLGLTGLESQEKETSGGNLVRTFGYGANRSRISEQTVSGTTSTNYTFGLNAHGDTSLLLDSTGVAKASYGYDPYGNEDAALSSGDSPLIGTTPSSNTDPINPFRYTAHRFDTGSGTIDMGARRFGPDTARFLQEDSYAAAPADVSLAGDPVNENRYGLAGGNPVNLVDADGHRASRPVYVNPFHLSRNLRLGRIDQGVDFSGNGPIVAIGNATVRGARCGQQTGWPPYLPTPTGCFVLYQLSNGPYKGHYIYVAEGVTPARHISDGKTVARDAPIVNFSYRGSPQCQPQSDARYCPGIETGWGSRIVNETGFRVDCGPYSDSWGWTAHGEAFARFLRSLGARTAPVSPRRGPTYTTSCLHG